jgi:hypothetical protein
MILTRSEETRNPVLTSRQVNTRKVESPASAARILWSDASLHLLIGLPQLLSFHETWPRWVSFRISGISE